MNYSKTVHLPVSPDEAFALLTEPERLRRWQAVTARVDLHAGGSFRWTVAPGHVAAGTVHEIDPGRHLVLGFGWEGSSDLAPDESTVTFTITPAGSGSGSEVTLTHTGLTDEQAAQHAIGWDHHLERLEELATTGDVAPDEWNALPDPIDELSSAEATLAILQPVLRGLTTEDRTRQTPCSEYDGHALAEHLMGSITGIASMAGATVTQPDEGSLEDRVSTMAGQALEAWRARGVDGTVPGPGGADFPASLAVSILSVEFLIHAWDFAQTSGQQLSAHDDLTTYVLDRLRQLIPEGREGGAFGAEVPLADDAPALERLVAFSGRRPLVHA